MDYEAQTKKEQQERDAAFAEKSTPQNIADAEAHNAGLDKEPETAHNFAGLDNEGRPAPTTTYEVGNPDAPVNSVVDREVRDGTEQPGKDGPDPIAGDQGPANGGSIGAVKVTGMGSVTDEEAVKTGGTMSEGHPVSNEIAGAPPPKVDHDDEDHVTPAVEGFRNTLSDAQASIGRLGGQKVSAEVKDEVIYRLSTISGQMAALDDYIKRVVFKERASEQ